MRTLICLLVLLATTPVFGEPELALVVGVDTLRNRAVPDTVFDVLGNIDEIRTKRVPDRLELNPVVGDTLRIELHALDWPEVIGWTVQMNRIRSRADLFHEFGDFYIISGLPTTTQGVVDLGNTFEIGQVSLGDSRGTGSGHLATTTFVFVNSGDSEILVHRVSITNLDSLNQTVSTNLHRRMTVAVSVSPEQIVVTADLDDNGVVGFEDFLAFVDHFGSRFGQGRFEDRIDFDGDGVIGFSDFLLLADDFGKPPRTYRTILRG